MSIECDAKPEEGAEHSPYNRIHEHFVSTWDARSRKLRAGCAAARSMCFLAGCDLRDTSEHRESATRGEVVALIRLRHAAPKAIHGNFRRRNPISHASHLSLEQTCELHDAGPSAACERRTLHSHACALASPDGQRMPICAPAISRD